MQTGTIIAVSIDDKHRFGKTPTLSATLVAGQGIEGDAHFGPCVQHRHLARRNPRAPNLRQVHLIANELLDRLRVAGYDVGPGELGENITTAGLDLERLPLDSELCLGATARLRLTGLRTPCVLIDRFKAGLKSHLVADGNRPAFRAGVMATVSSGGEVSPGDVIRVVTPGEPHRPLPAI